MSDFLANNAATINFILINMALGLSIYLTLSIGLLSVANAGFMAIGAYTAAVVATQTSLPLAVSFVLGMVLAALVALPLGLLVLRLRDVYLAIATVGFGQIVTIIFLNGDKVVRALTGDGQRTVFNGAEGITLAYSSPRLILGLPVTTWPLILYLLALVYLLATLHGSHFGRMLASIRLDESAASTLGINVLKYRLISFILGAAIAAGAGALSTPIVRVVDPRGYTFSRAVEILAYAVLGGMTHWVGPIVGALLLTALPEVLRFLRDQREVVNGVIIMLAIIYLPRGLADPRFWSSWRRRRAAPEPTTDETREPVRAP
ncbi:MAG: branched-chain amino acid ABC transporter permease [Chloroflexi bacterium]|nr:branched-chain amino acid ABC transporter permease [Chloroflexota bacterium]